MPGRRFDGGDFFKGRVLAQWNHKRQVMFGQCISCLMQLVTGMKQNIILHTINIIY